MEVIYQLRGRADYLIATQGLTFVNNVTFRQVIKKVLNTVKNFKDDARRKAIDDQENPTEAVNNAHVDMDELVRKIYFHSMHNTTDFITVGYSADLVLCDLNRKKLEATKQPIQNLVRRLKPHLTREPDLIKDMILLAHWEAQSFHGERYTDLYDFCLCLAKRGEQAQVFAGNEELRTELLKLAKECELLMSAIRNDSGSGLVVLEDNQGMSFPFARGLSVYFPWCEPLDDQREFVKLHRKDASRPRGAAGNTIMSNYLKYDFNQDFGSDSWGSFLETYFDATMRRLPDDDVLRENTDAFSTADDIFHAGLTLDQKRTPELEQKRTPEVGTRTPEEGSECGCPTIKNYPTDRKKRNTRQFTITPDALRAFHSVSDDIE